MNDKSTIENHGYKAIDQAPTLKKFYGIGTALYLKTMVDKNSNLYSKIYFFTVLFIPVLYLGRYLIREHDGNEFVVGKASPPTLAKAWNALLIIVLLGASGVGGYLQYSNLPETIAGNQLRQGLANVEIGNFSIGIPELRMAYRSGTRHAAAAKQQLSSMTSKNYISNLEPIDAAEVFEQFLEMPELFPNLITDAEVQLDLFVEKDLLAAKKAIKVILALENDEGKQLAFQKQHYEILAQLTTQNPTDVELVVEFASLDEIYNQCQRCESLLSPHQQALGLSEGARILGQIYAYNGRYEESYSLLQPYVTEGLATYHRLESEYNDLGNKIWEDMIEFLNTSRAPQSFINKYNASSEDEQNRLLNEYYLERLEASEPYRLAEVNYYESTAVVSVALDLGIVMLNRAVTMTDPQQRQQELQSAEQTFLAVKGQAEDSDDYQLYLGQVYYWLGKEEDGKVLFDALIEKYDRGPGVLYSLSSILRDLGEAAQAKSYATEAYASAVDPAEKEGIAMHLSVLADTLDEKIEWLEKSDPNNLHTKADLLSSKAALALEADDKAKALELYNQSIAVYKELPEDATSFNNAALVYMAKYQTSRDESDYQKGLDLMDRAIILDPDDSIILINSIDNHLGKALRDVLSEYIDIEAFEGRLQLGMFSSLYDSFEQKQVFVKQMLAHQSTQKALGYTNKALLLSPKSASLASQSMSLFYFLDKQAELEALAARMENIDFDLADAEQKIREYRQQEDVSEVVEALDKSNKYYRDLLLNLNEEKLGLEISMLKGNLQENQLTSLSYDLEVDIDSLLADARMTVSEYPASSTRAVLQSSLMFKTVENLRKIDSEFSNFQDHNDKLYDLFTQLALYTLQHPDFAKKVTSQASFQEWLNLAAHSNQHYPYVTDVREWFLLEVLEQDLADSLLERMQTSMLHYYFSFVAAKMSANRESNTVNLYLSHQINGNQDAAKALAVAAQEQQLDIPPVLFAFNLAVE